LLALTTHALDVGAMTPFFWGFEEREKLMEFMNVFVEHVFMLLYTSRWCCSRFTRCLIEDIYLFTESFHKRIDEINELLTNIVYDVSV